MLAILAMANGISVLTSLSLSAVATNLRVKRGGDYDLISRTLGHEVGGAIGLVMFLAQSISSGFYCIGFAEVLAGLLPAPLFAHSHVREKARRRAARMAAKAEAARQEAQALSILPLVAEGGQQGTVP